MRKLILKTKFSLGDVVMMTAAIRDLHRCYPKQFLTDVRTHFPEVWENNPYITYLEESRSDVEVINCHYPLINYANSRPYHCLHGYISFLNTKLGLQIVPTAFKGDIHLSREEKEWASQVHEIAGEDIPFWIVSAGGKHDITIKWWATERYQSVVDHFRGRIAFVQIGETGHHHPKLDGTIDLRGQTSVRELIRLVYHAQGCLCSVTSLMHLAAAVEAKPGLPPNRACVVVAGGREPVHWEAYPHHQFLHTVGSLRCCANGGCWKARVVPLGDGKENDKPDSVCSDVVEHLPRCMHMISPAMVAEGIQKYFDGGILRYLEGTEIKAAHHAVRISRSNTYDSDSLNRYNSPKAIEDTIQALLPYPGGFKGRGVVICGGGIKYFPCAWVCISMLRHFGCGLPVEFWYQGAEEMDASMIKLLESLGVVAVDATKVAEKHPRRASGGWELKAYALVHSSFKEVLLLDADNVPVKDPSFLFEEPNFKKTGAVFWPDYGSLEPEREIWAVCGIPYRHEPEFESGQILVDKQKCWRALNLAHWFNEHSDFYYQFIHGDKETFHLAWRKLNRPYTMVPTPIRSLKGIMCQHDLDGNRLFQHRNSHKWKAFGRNRRVKGFRYESLCLSFLADLERQWDGKIRFHVEHNGSATDFTFRCGTFDQMIFRDVCDQNEYELPDQFGAKDVIIDIGAHIGCFSYACLTRGAAAVLAFEPNGENFKIAQQNLTSFKGRFKIQHKAVWRSDRHPTWLLHSGYAKSRTGLNTGGGTVLVEAQSKPDHTRKEVVGTISLDRILRPFTTIRLLKLDCEGSEWPILFTSKHLHKVASICGEYHELNDIPSSALAPGYSRYTKKELEEFLRRYYKKVRIQPSADKRLGHFWASSL